MTLPKGTRIKLSGTPPTVIAFDDDVLECFFADGSTRIYIIHVKGIELADNKGKYLLTIHLLDKDLYIWVDEKQFAPVKELVDQIKQVISSSQS
jgi:hypothetical protein